MGRVLEWLQKQYGCLLESNEKTVTLSTTPALVLMGNPDRFEVAIFNLGSSAVFLSMDSDPSTTKGMMIAASGGSLSYNARDDGEMPTRRYYAVAASGTPTIYVLETQARG
jgi:hypothetical protein